MKNDKADSNKEHSPESPATDQTSSLERADVPITTEPVLILAVGRDEAGKLFVVPIDNEHKEDNQTPLSAEEGARLETSIENLYHHLPVLQEALESLYDIFAGCLERGRFRRFENFCFALLGMARIPSDKEEKAIAKARRLQKGTNQ